MRLWGSLCQFPLVIGAMLQDWQVSVNDTLFFPNIPFRYYASPNDFQTVKAGERTKLLENTFTNFKQHIYFLIISACLQISHKNSSHALINIL